mmetsp:Transcript_22498/g.67444  ORF Transcript_22498/g.67444 Transcript_22498/m.67444 type:complete len:204 (+) Transcript_22498:608-1219(+)
MWVPPHHQTPLHYGQRDPHEHQYAAPQIRWSRDVREWLRRDGVSKQVLRLLRRLRVQLLLEHSAASEDQGHKLQTPAYPQMWTHKAIVGNCVGQAECETNALVDGRQNAEQHHRHPAPRRCVGPHVDEHDEVLDRARQRVLLVPVNLGLVLDDDDQHRRRVHHHAEKPDGHQDVVPEPLALAPAPDDVLLRAHHEGRQQQLRQ